MPTELTKSALTALLHSAQKLTFAHISRKHLEVHRMKKLLNKTVCLIFVCTSRSEQFFCWRSSFYLLFCYFFMFPFKFLSRSVFHLNYNKKSTFTRVQIKFFHVCSSLHWTILILFRVLFV